LNYASFRRRLAAGFIDFGLNLAVTTAVGWIASQAKPFAVLLMPLLWLAAIVHDYLAGTAVIFRAERFT
jgi:hypothetical protein